MNLIAALIVIGAADGALLDRQPHAFPFATYAEWSGFMEKAPDPAQRPKSVSVYLSKAQFDACVGQESVVRERIQYVSDGLRVRAIMALPRRAGPAPLVVFLHGGIGRWGKITTLDVLEFCHLAEQGYAVLAPTFRGEGGSEGKPNLGDGEVADVLNLLKVADSLPEIDATRAALWGFSRGGGAGYRTLAKTDRFRVAVLQAATADLVNNPRREEFHQHVYPDVIPNYASDPTGALEAVRCPVARADQPEDAPGLDSRPRRRARTVREQRANARTPERDRPPRRACAFEWRTFAA